MSGVRRRTLRPAVLAGMLLPVAGRTLIRRTLLVVTRCAIRALNRGDIRPALRLYAADAVVRQGEGSHRWAGEHRGRRAIAAFLRSMTDAGIQGSVRDLLVSGPPWSLRAIVLFDERVTDATGRTSYANELAFVLRLRWAKIVEHTDLVLSSARLETLEVHLRTAARTP